MDRRAELWGVKLRALVGECTGATPIDAPTLPYPNGAVLVEHGRAWVYAASRATLGGALAIALRHEAEALAIVVDDDPTAAAIARRAGRVSFPVDVFVADGRRLRVAVPSPLEPIPPADPAHMAFVDTIAEAGATPHVEWGIVTGEVRGLEVCRVVDAPTVGQITGFAAESGPIVAPTDGIALEVGVGPNDREAFRLIHGEIPPAAALADVVRTVERHRSDDAPQHPLNRMARERLLRWRLEQDPSPIGVAVLAAADPPVPRPGLRETAPCVATGVTSAGDPVAVVCSAGIDIDLAGFVADVAGRTDAPIVVAVPGRDRAPITEQLLALVDHDVTLVAAVR